ncbi:MAG: hypothetical protein RIR49_1928 [Actinomycetota bacterium]|jgi:hypothetical protein
MAPGAERLFGSDRYSALGDADLGGAEIEDAARSSLVVSLLTADNLPNYFADALVGDGRAHWVDRGVTLADSLPPK